MCGYFDGGMYAVIIEHNTGISPECDDIEDICAGHHNQFAVHCLLLQCKPIQHDNLAPFAMMLERMFGCSLTLVGAA